MTHAVNKFSLVMATCLSPLVLTLILMVQPASAQTQMDIVESRNQDSGQLLFQSDDIQGYYLAPRMKTDVTMNITGLVARVKVSQHFSNPSDVWLNGIYTFPLPDKSAVDHMRLLIGERVIEGQIKRKEKARKVYQAAKQSGKKASLLEQQRSNVFTTKVANVAPGETVTVEIEYQQILSYDMGEFSLRFPMVVAPRYHPPKGQIKQFNADGWATPMDEPVAVEPVDVEASEPVVTLTKAANDPDSHQVTMQISLETGFELAALESDFHPIEVNELTTGVYDINLQDDKVLANRDFVLRFRPVASDMPQGAYFSQVKGNQQYGLLMVLPPVEANERQVMNKEVVFVIDTSGSMHGQSMEQAKQALLLGILRLNANDRFNVITFSNEAKALFRYEVEASDDNKALAREFIARAQAQGGTNIANALTRSLQQSNHSLDDGFVRQVIFITDGSVSNEQALFSQIHQDLADSRLFTVGIGSAPNSRFMRGAATAGRGTYTYIGDLNQVKSHMSELFRKLESPVLADVNLLDATGQSLTDSVDYWPNPISDLYLGEPIIVSVRLPLDQQNLTLKGQLANRDWQMDLPIDSGVSASTQSKGLDVLWARNKIHSLSESARDAKQRLNNEKVITQLGLDFHLVTRYTSLVAVDVTPARSINQPAIDSKVANHLPDGWTAHRPHGQLPQGSTSARFNMLVGVLLLLLAGLMLRHKKGGCDVTA